MKPPTSFEWWMFRRVAVPLMVATTLYIVVADVRGCTGCRRECLQANAVDYHYRIGGRGLPGRCGCVAPATRKADAQ